MAVGARCVWMWLSGWWGDLQQLFVWCLQCKIFCTESTYQPVTCCLQPAACPHLSRTTFSRERPSRSQVPTLMSQRTYFAWTEAEQSGECGGVGARGGEEGRWAQENNIFALKQHRAIMKNILFCLGGPHLLSLFQTFELIISENLGGYAYF